MSEEFVTGATEQEFAEPAVTEPVEQVEVSENTQEVAEPVDTKPVQDAETNSRFADIRRRAEQEARDNLIREMFGESHGINSYAEYQQALQRQQIEAEAEEKGMDPELYAQIQGLIQDNQYSKYENNLLRQKDALQQEPFFNDWFNDIDAFARAHKVDYETGYAFMARQRLRDVVENTQRQGEQKAIQNIISRDSAAVGPANGSPSTLKTDVWNMNKDDFQALVEKAKRGEIKQF